MKVFSEVWGKIIAPVGEWPEGYKSLKGKLFFQERLCVPEGLVSRLISEHHAWNAHVDNKRLAHDIRLRYELPPAYALFEELEKVRKFCLVCQASQPPNWAKKQLIS